MTLLTKDEYLGLGRQILPLLGSSLAGPSAVALGELARGQNPAVDDARIGAEVFLFHKYLLMKACVGVFPEAHVDHVVEGLLAALNERTGGLALSPERQGAMEEMWQLRAEQFDRTFSSDQRQILDDLSGSLYWKETISQFYQNVHEMADPPDIWVEHNGPSHAASQSVTAAFDTMLSGLEEISRTHFSEPV